MSCTSLLDILEYKLTRRDKENTDGKQRQVYNVLLGNKLLKS